MPLSRVFGAGHPERPHGMDAAAAQLPGPIQGLLSGWVSHQVWRRLAGGTVMVLMQGSGRSPQAPRAHALDTGPPDPHHVHARHQHAHSHDAGIEDTHAHHPEADDAHRHHADAHHPHRHDADRDDPQGRHTDGDPLGLIPALRHWSSWPQWDDPEQGASPCMAQGIHWFPILWAPVQLKCNLAAFSASGWDGYRAGTPPEPVAGEARAAAESSRLAPIAVAARALHGLRTIDIGLGLGQGPAESSM